MLLCEEDLVVVVHRRSELALVHGLGWWGRLLCLARRLGLGALGCRGLLGGGCAFLTSASLEVLKASLELLACESVLVCVIVSLGDCDCDVR